MPSIIVQLDPNKLANPDLDIRYVLPDLLVAKSAGRLIDDGYDYVETPGDGPGNSFMLLFLRTEDVSAALPGVIATLQSERVLGNDLSAVPVAVEDDQGFRVVHPEHFAGEFRRPGGS
jgi:hypothetical protein